MGHHEDNEEANARGPRHAGSWHAGAERWSIRRLVIALLLGLFALCVLVYAADWLQLQLRKSRGSAYGSMLVERTIIVREKGSKVEYYSDPPQPTPCVRALFPHEGQSACWWLARHIDEQQYLN